MFKKVALTMYPVSDVPRARRFYEQTLGLTPGLAGNQGDKYGIEYDVPDGGCLAIPNTTGDAPGGGTVALEVEDLDRAIGDLKSTFARRIGKDHELARGLWQSGWYEARSAFLTRR